MGDDILTALKIIFRNSKGTQNAQETEIESYVIGGIKQDVKKDQFKKFKL